MAANPVVGYERIRNEAIQMFRDLPNGQRDTLYNRVRVNPSTPDEVTDPDGGPIVYLGRGFAVFMTRSNTSPNWGELNSICASLVVNGMDSIRAAKLYYIVHQELLAMGYNPAAGAANMPPPPVPWINATHGNDIRQVAGLGVFFVPPPTPADHPFPGVAPVVPAPVVPAPVVPVPVVPVPAGPVPVVPAPVVPVPAGPVPVVPAAPQGAYAQMPHMGLIAVPAGTENIITTNAIAPGDEMVDFHGESGYGRYYKRSTFDLLPTNPQGLKKNPTTRAIIQPGNVHGYTAQGGKRRKQRTARRKTRRAHTLRKKRRSGV